jgi:hypothetical protein
MSAIFAVLNFKQPAARPACALSRLHQEHKQFLPGDELKRFGAQRPNHPAGIPR